MGMPLPSLQQLHSPLYHHRHSPHHRTLNHLLPLDLQHRRNHHHQQRHFKRPTAAVPPPTVRRTSAASTTAGTSTTITRFATTTTTRKLAFSSRQSFPSAIDIRGAGGALPRLPHRSLSHLSSFSPRSLSHLSSFSRGLVAPSASPSRPCFDPRLGGSGTRTNGVPRTLAPSPTPTPPLPRRRRILIVENRCCCCTNSFRLCLCSCGSVGASPSCSCECAVGPSAGPRGFGRILRSAWGRRSSVGAESLGGSALEAPISRPGVGFGRLRRRNRREQAEFRILLRRPGFFWRGKGGGADRRWSHGCRYVPLFWDEEEPEIGGASPVGRQFAKMNFKEATLPISTAPAGSSVLDGQKVKSARMTKRGAVVALSYMFCAVMLVMFNKAALSTYKFPCTNVIIVLQIVCSTATLFVLRKANLISFANEGSAVNLDESGFVTMRTLQRASPLAISYLFYMVVGMSSIRGVNVPMYTTLRRTTVLFTMIMEYFLAGQKHSTPIISTVGLIVLGAFIAGARDLSFDSYGYFVVLISNVTTALYLTTISRLGKSTGLNSFGLMWCNGLICGPILLVWTLLNGELALASQFPAVSQPSFQLVILLSCMMAFCLNYTIFLNTSLNSALTQTMCGNLKDFGTVLIGWMWFGGLPFDWLNIVGQLLGFMGSGLYAYCKLRGI